nr:PucR family transcriptional regulator [Paeniglutamicibacter psychrophenolicus]
MIHDREKGRRDFLEALIAGNQPGRIATHAKHFNLKVDSSYFVVLVRRRPGRQNASISMRLCLETVQKSISGTQAKVGLVGTRDEEVVVIVESIKGTPLGAREQLDLLASLLPEFSVTVGRLRKGLQTVAQGYVDAQNATSFAVLNKIPRAYLFSDTLLDQIARTSPFRHDLAGDTTDLIAAYDAKRGSDLLATIRAYIDCGFKLVQTAEILKVQPNTVKYRLNRIGQITGHDPFQVQGMTLFTLALRIPPDLDSA